MFLASSLNGSAIHAIRTVAGVLALHVAAWWCLSQMPLAWRNVVATHPAITVFLLDSTDKPARLAATPVAASQHRAPVAAVRAETGTAADEPAASGRAAAITLEPNRDAGDASSPAPLNLQLPKGWSPQSVPRHPALEFQPGQRQPMTLESRLTQALGDGHWTEERLGDGRLRLRHGNRCVYLRRNRSDELHPFNASPTPWTAQAGAC